MGMLSNDTGSRPIYNCLPVFVAVSQATFERGSTARQASKTASDTWSAILSGCPSPTDSEVKRKVGFLTPLVSGGLTMLLVSLFRLIFKKIYVN